MGVWGRCLERDFRAFCCGRTFLGCGIVGLSWGWMMWERSCLEYGRNGMKRAVEVFMRLCRGWGLLGGLGDVMCMGCVWSGMMTVSKKVGI